MSSAKTLLIAVASFAAAAHLTTGEPASQTVTRTAKTPARLPMHFGLRNAAEEQFVRKFANEFSQTLAVVAANPDVSFPAGSFAAHVRSGYMQLEPSRRRAFRPGSLKLLPTTGATRPTALVRVDAQDVATLRVQPPGFNPAMRQEFRTLINNRIDGFPSIVGSLTRSKSAGLIRQPKTWIEGGVFGEADAGGKQEITLNQPQVLGFKWRSEEIGARAGYWELKQGATGQLRERVLATGTTGMDMSKPGSQGSFEIDFAKYLPPKPPTLGAAAYTVRIKPLAQQRPELQKVRPGGKIGPSTTPKIAPVGPPKEPDGVGPWSTYVVIHYGVSTTPPQTFHDVDRRVHFYLDSIYMVEDQQELGAEAFSVDGFIQWSSPSGAGNQYRLGGFAKLDMDGPRLHRYNGRVTFDLPSAGDFPRSYTVVLSILERDDGGMWGDWQQALWKIAREALSDEIELAMKERLSELRAKMASDGQAEEAMKAGIEALRESTTNDFYTAWLKMVVTIIIGAIEGGLPDDYYGTEVVTFVMPTNRADVIGNTFAFWSPTLERVPRQRVQSY